MKRVQTRRAVLGFGALLTTPTLLAAARARAASATPDASLAGQLLIATPDMRDPRFSQTVIIVVRHDVTGALGIVINRPVREIAIGDLLRALGLDDAGSDGTVMLFAGGPVEPEAGLIVHTADYRRAGTIDIDGRVAMTSDTAVLRDIGRHAGPRRSLIAFGYAGWGPDQLAAEIAAGVWFTVPEEPGLVFDIERDKLWNEATRRRIIPL